MLVLSRYKDDRITLRKGDIEVDIVVVEIVQVNGRKKVRLGIEAPQSVEIIRGELKDHWKGRQVTT